MCSARHVRTHLLAALEVRLEVLGLEAVGEVDVAADLLPLGIAVPDEDDGLCACA